MRTLENYEHENYGFNQNHLLTFGIDPTRQGYQGDRLINLYQQVQDRVRALPGVTAATTMDFAPFSGWSSNTEIVLDNKPNQTDNPLRWMRVGPDFFSTMQIPVILGRALDRRDTATSPLVIVVDENFVKKYYPHENPIGHHFSLSARSAPTEAVEIVGVCRPAELTNVHANPRPKAFAPYSQYLRFLNTMYFEVRTAGDPGTVISEVRDTVRDADPGLPLMGLKTQTEEREEGLVQERLFARLSGFFGLLALALAMIGLYGTMAYAVARKRHEIGIRMTLGAEPAHVLRMVIGGGVKLAAIGAAIGAVLSLSTASLARSVIFGVTPEDPLTLTAAAAVLMLVAAVACYVPARRAMKVDPMVALRYE